jgi:hypothetical protein
MFTQIGYQSIRREVNGRIRAGLFYLLGSSENCNELNALSRHASGA